MPGPAACLPCMPDLAHSSNYRPAAVCRPIWHSYAVSVAGRCLRNILRGAAVLGPVWRAGSIVFVVIEQLRAGRHVARREDAHPVIAIHLRNTPSGQLMTRAQPQSALMIK